MNTGKHRRSRFGEISAELYAEYAAYLSSETLEFYVKKRREVSAAIYVQYHYRRYRSARNREQLERLLIWRMLLRWWNINIRIKAARQLCRSCKSFIARSLLEFLRYEVRSAIGSTRHEPIGQAASGSIPEPSQAVSTSHGVFPATPQYGAVIEGDNTSLRETERTVILTSPNLSVGADELMGATNATPSAPVSPAKTVQQVSPTRRKRMVFIHESSEDEDTASRTQETASPSPEAPAPTIVQEDPVAMNIKKLELVRSKILVYLVTKLQALYRGQKGRATAARLKRVRDQKRELDHKMQALREAVFKAAEARNAKKPPKARKALPPVVESSLVFDEETSPPAKKKSTPRTTTVNAETERAPAGGEAQQTDVSAVLLQETANGVEYPEGGDFAINEIKAKILSYQCQSALKWFEAHALINQAAYSISHAEQGMLAVESRIISMDPVGILIPQDVEGLLDHGVVVDEMSPIKGSQIGGAGWVVAEVTDAEMYELHPEVIKASATKIQKVFRRFMTRRKFMAYLQEKDLSFVRDEERQARTAGSSEDGDGAGGSSAIRGANEIVSTESCVIS